LGRNRNEDAVTDRPLPHPDPATAPYWAGASKGEFTLPQCETCERFHFYPRALCPHCGSQAIRWSASPGRGSVYSVTVVHRAPSPAFESMVPYAVAVVALDEGPHLMSNIINCNAADVSIGQRVQVTFLEMADDIALPAFEPVTDQS
jgi:hypothetical protein